MKISTQIVLGFLFTLLIIVVITFTFYIEKNRFESDSKLVIHTNEVLKKSAQLQRLLSDMETGFRGYLISDRKEFLEPYEKGIQLFPDEHNHLFQLVNDNQLQQEKLRTIIKMFADWENSITKPLIYSKQISSSSDSAMMKYENLLSERIKSGIGMMKTDRIRNEFKRFDEREFELQKERNTKFEESLINVNRIFIGLMFFSFVFVLFLTMLISKSITSRINKLVELSEDLAIGKFDISKGKDTNDELKPLAESLKFTAIRLDEAFSEIKASNNELDQFAYVVSHDLKAPLRAITNLASWIEEDIGIDIKPEVTKHVTMLKARIVRMEGLINGLLEYSRVGKIKIENEKVNTLRLLNDIVSELDIQPPLKINIQKKMPVVLAPKLRLRQVFQNLIDNAVKYGIAESPQIDIRCNEYPDFFEFCVADNGPGIDAAFHEKIFVIFQTLEARDKIESTGIGLAIIKKIVEENKGSIKIDSQLGKGSKFIFTWPKNNLSENIM